MDKTIPLVIIVKDRLKVLQDSVASYVENITSPFELVFHDNRSTHPPTIEYLSEMEKQGHRVYYYPERESKKLEQESINLTVDELKKDMDFEFFVLTDPDIELMPSDGKILELYQFILNAFPSIDGVGPQLKIDDIPPSYPLRGKVLERHQQFYDGKNIRHVSWQGREIPLKLCKIDSTFHLRRAGQKWEKLAGEYYSDVRAV